MDKAYRTIASAALVAMALLASMSGFAEAQRPDGCGQLKPYKLPPTQDGGDLLIKVDCEVGPGTYYVGNVNIIAGGVLRFTDPPSKADSTHLWAKSILVETGGQLIAGSPTARIGANGGVVTIHLYGADQGTGKNGPGPGKGITCITQPNCGIPDNVWTSNGASKVPLPGNVSDNFYQYDTLPFDGGDPKGYFGYKVLAVSYGGTLQLFGTKGVATPEPTSSSDSGTSWVRLNGSVKTGATQLVVEVPGGRTLNWESGDTIVITTTDYLPGHSEERTIDTITGNTITLTQALQYDHSGVKYDMSRVPAGVGPDVKSAETRAVVALLSRSIQIVSAGGDKPAGLPPPDFPADSFFGGHTIVRQGFQSFQVQGVEFKQLGQGGRLGHYPVHFHMARKTPAETFIKDSSINESMTRWVVLHATHGVLVARNVGWKSIGHGFYLEEGSEIDNRFLSNVGIFARAAVVNANGTPQRDNPRKVPGILAAPRPVPPPFNDNIPFHTDSDHPSVYWIMNGWNDFEYNMAAGAGTCGACYWFVPGANSGMSRHMAWEGYASLQMWDNTEDEHLRPLNRAAMTPLRKFVGNYCSTAQNSFNTVGDTTPCNGVGGPNDGFPHLQPVINTLAPPSCFQDNRNLPNSTTPDPNGCQFHPEADDYYPKVDPGGGRFATNCDKTDCRGSRNLATNVPRCGNGADEANCTVTILDHYTSSFHWTETNFAAIWLRPQWYLVTNSVLSDVQNGGLTFITGGGYTQSDVINGHWALARKTAFIGHTQTGNPLASNAGPFSSGGLSCDTQAGNHCLSQAEGVAFPISNFGVNQRLFNIYDGPAYQESNAYLDIIPTALTDCHAFKNDCSLTPCVCSENSQCVTGTCTASGQCTCSDSKNSPTGNPDCPGKAGCSNGLCPLPSSICSGSASMYGRTIGIPQDDNHVCYLPNAAIAWKQPNGFYYPPAFHSRNLYFDPAIKENDPVGSHNVEIRHFVIEPFFKARASEGDPLFKTDLPKIMARYCTWNPLLFDNYTDVDRQTELDDDDGSLTGYVKTISVNEDPFFKAPVEAFECQSDLTAKTSPYDYVSTVVYPGCAVAGNCNDSIWSLDCTSPTCFGVPLYRQYRTGDETKTEAHQVKMMGQAIYQRSTLSVNGGKYYVDTTVSQSTQQASKSAQFSVFQAGQTYYLFLLFGKGTTTQTYQFYVGTGFTKDDENQLSARRAVVDKTPFNFETKITPWPSGWVRKYGPSDGLPEGILEVTIDLAAYKPVFDASGESLCRPKRFCKWDGTQQKNKCQCALSPGDYFYDECKANDSEICSWSVKDFACPDGGCFGIAVTLPGGFNNAGLASKKPPTKCFPTTQAPWNVNFTPAAADLAGSCAQPAPPPIPACSD